MIYIQDSVYQQLRETLGTHLPECGGVLGAAEGKAISHYSFDSTGISSPVAYTPDYMRINDILENWNHEGIEFVGIIHSHDSSCPYPSCGDLVYACRMLLSNPSLDSMLMPIVTIDPFSIHMYRVSLGDRKPIVHREDWSLLD